MADISKSALLKIVADDADAEEKLDRISLKADELREKHPELSIRIDTAEATAKLAVFREELKAATRSAEVTVDERAGKSGLLGRLLLGSEFAEGNGNNGNVGGILGALPDFLSPATLGIIAGLIPVLFAVVTELSALAAGLAAAGAGAGAFALLAMPAFEKVKNAYTGISTAQGAYQQALENEKKDPTKANAEAAAKALEKLKGAWKGLTPDERDAVKGIQHLKTEWEKASKAFEPDVFKVFNKGLDVANNLLPVVAPLAKQFAGALDGLLGKVGKFTESKGFKDWIGQFSQLTGPATTAIGQGIGRILTNFGKLITLFSGKDVAHGINIAFDIISGSIRGVTYVVGHLMHSWDELSHATGRLVHDIKNWWDDAQQWITSALVAIGGAATRLVGDLKSAWGRAETDVQHWESDVVQLGGKVVTWFEQLPGRIVRAVGNLGSLLIHAGESIIDGLIDGIKSRIPSVQSILSDITNLIPHFKGPPAADRVLLYGSGQMIMGGLIGGIGSQVPALQRQLSGVTSVIGAGLRGHAGSGGAGNQLTLRVTGSGSGLDNLFMTWLKNAVRTEGGNPAMFSRKVVLA